MTEGQEGSKIKTISKELIQKLITLCLSFLTLSISLIKRVWKWMNTSLEAPKKKKRRKKEENQNLSEILILKWFFLGLCYLAPILLLVLGYQSEKYGPMIIKGLYWSIGLLAVGAVCLYIYARPRISKDTDKSTTEGKYEPCGKRRYSEFFKNFREASELLMAFIPLFIVLLAILALYWVSILKKDSIRIQQQTRQQVEERAVAPTPPIVEQRLLNKGTLTWYKPNGDRSDPMDVTVLRNDGSIFEFTAAYPRDGAIREARFRWDKREKCGRWYQTFPSDGGEWYLRRTDDSAVYVGSCNDKNGVVTSLILKLNTG